MRGDVGIEKNAKEFVSLHIWRKGVFKYFQVRLRKTMIQIHRSWMDINNHKVHIYKSTTVYVPSSELGLSPPLLSPAIVPLPPNQRWGAHSPAGQGVGESQFRRLEKKLSTLPTLCK